MSIKTRVRVFKSQSNQSSEKPFEQDDYRFHITQETIFVINYLYSTLDLPEKNYWEIFEVKTKEKLKNVSNLKSVIEE